LFATVLAEASKNASFAVGGGATKGLPGACSTKGLPGACLFVDGIVKLVIQFYGFRLCIS